MAQEKSGVKSFKSFVAEQTIQEAIEYHINNDKPLAQCIFRPHSQAFYQFFEHAREQYNDGLLEVNDPFDIDLLQTEIGKFGDFDGETVPLDIPMMEAQYDGKDVELNSPKRGGPKKFYVYVKDPKTGNVKKVTFGDTSGLDVKLDDLEARKSFAARHKCDQKKDKTKPGYWSCNLPRYADQLGLKNGGNFFW